MAKPGRFTEHVRSRRFFRWLGNGGKLKSSTYAQGPRKGPFFAPAKPVFFLVLASPLLRAAGRDLLRIPLREDGTPCRRKNTDVRPTPTEPITCPHCGGQAYLMRGTLHPKIKGEIWTFECKDQGLSRRKRACCI